MKKITSLLLVFIMVLSLFTACGNNQTVSTDETTVSSDETKDNQNGDNSAETEPESEKEPVKTYSFPYELTAEKIGTINVEKFLYADGGLYYSVRENDTIKYGILAHDGSNDTGAVYYNCKSVGGYFAVTTDGSEVKDINEMNRYGIVDYTGKVIVPEEYCAFKELNERYIQAMKVTEITDSQDDALVYYSTNEYSFFPSDGDTFFKGEWYIYDVNECKKIDGISGTQASGILAYGDYIKYYTDDGTMYIVDETGAALPAGATLFDDGSYRIVTGGTGTVYDTDGNVLFTYDPSYYEPKYVDGEYYTASKYINRDEGSNYKIINKKGEFISGEFPELPYIHGQTVKAGNSLYKLDGTLIITAESIGFDSIFDGCCLAVNGDTYTYISTATGEIVAEITVDGETVQYNSTVCNVYKTTDNGKLYYSFTDNDFTIEATNSTGTWICNKNAGNYYFDLINAATGDTLIENYKDYSYNLYAESPDSYYVYAQNGNDTYDVYIIK